MDVIQQALQNTEVRGNASREFHLSLTLLGLPDRIRGSFNLTENSVHLEEYELSKNGQWLKVDAQPMVINREVVTSAQVIYLDGEA